VLLTFKLWYFVYFVYLVYNNNDSITFFNCSVCDVIYERKIMFPKQNYSIQKMWILCRILLMNWLMCMNISMCNK